MNGSKMVCIINHFRPFYIQLLFLLLFFYSFVYGHHGRCHSLRHRRIIFFLFTFIANHDKKRPIVVIKWCYRNFIVSNNHWQCDERKKKKVNVLFAVRSAFIFVLFGLFALFMEEMLSFLFLFNLIHRAIGTKPNGPANGYNVTMSNILGSSGLNQVNKLNIYLSYGQ